ncbi:MAG: hypothetical protein ACRDL3_02530 [Solirubrobacterales bacterium]
MIEAGLLLALGCALLTNVAMLCKHRGANRAPDVRFSRPLRSAAELFRSRWWTIGFGVAFAAWGLHVAALALAPLSLVQAVIAGGLVLLVVPAKHWFGITLGPRELTGIALSAVGLAFLALTATDGGAHSDYSQSAMISFEAGAVGIGVALLLSHRHERVGPHGGLLLGAAGGLLIGVSDVAIKALADTVPAAPLSILSPWTLVAALSGLGAFYALARSLQLGGAIDVIVISSIAVNIAAITGGVLVFGDPIGSNALAVVARSAAFAAVIVAAALIPAVPRRASGEPQAQPA